jgi:hypothetical protein
VPRESSTRVRLALFALGGAVLVALLTGGRPSRIAEVRFRCPLAGIGGVVLQLIPAGGTLGVALLISSFVLLGLAAAANVRLPGFPLILAGLALNFLVIAVNGGMPVTANALAASGQQATMKDLVENGGSKHHLATDADDLVVLADSIPLGAPVHQAVSVGDLMAYAGAAWFIVRGMHRRGGVPSPGDPQIVETSP